MGLIPDQGIKIPHALWHGQKDLKNQINKIKLKKKREGIVIIPTISTRTLEFRQGESVTQGLSACD